MNVTIKQVTNWDRALNAARWTVGKDELLPDGWKEPSDKFKTEMMMSCHSPKRMVEYDILIKGIPYYVAVHFVRHHVGVEKFQCTLRDDRNKEISDRTKLPQDQPVNLWMAVNADSLQSISYLRLCGMAAATTRMVWNAVYVEMKKVDPIVARFMVPQCIRYGFCPEAPDKSCKYVLTKRFAESLKEYRKGFLTNEDCENGEEKL